MTKKGKKEKPEVEGTPAARAEIARKEIALENTEADKLRFEELISEGNTEAEAASTLAKEQKERAESQTDEDGNRISKTKGVLTGDLAKEVRNADKKRESVQALEEQRKEAEKAAKDAE